MPFCIHCGTAIPEDGKFCPGCGKSQTTKYQQVFQRGSMSEDQFIAQINQWFAQYPKVANVKGTFTLRHGIGLLANKYVLEAFSIEYELLNGQNTKQYAVTLLQNTALVKTTTDELLAQWKQANPNAIVVSRNGGVNQRGSTGSLLLGGIGAVNNTQLYVFYKYDRKTCPGKP